VNWFVFVSGPCFFLLVFLGKRLTHKAQIFAAQSFCGADFSGFWITNPNF